MARPLKNPRPAACHPELPHYAREMCYNCWMCDWRERRAQGRAFPPKDTRVARFLKYFQDNPGEALTYDDAVTKFSFPHKQAVIQTVSRMKARGLLKSVVVIVKGDGDDSIE